MYTDISTYICILYVFYNTYTCILTLNSPFWKFAQSFVGCNEKALKKNQ